MLTAKIFENGRSQAVRLPKEFRFSEDEVLISKVGNVVMLMPKNHEWAPFLQGIQLLGDDFMEDGRIQGKCQEREGF